MPAHPTTTPRTAARPTDAPQRVRRRPSPRAWLPLGVCTVAVAVIGLGVLDPLLTVLVLGLFLAGVAHPSRGPGARPLTRSRRTTLAALAIAVAGGLSGLILATGLLAQREWLAALVALAAVSLLGLPFAMSEGEPGDAGRGRASLTRRNLVLALTGGLVMLGAHAGGVTYVVLLNVAVLVPVAVLAQRLWGLRRGGARIRPAQALNELAFWGLVALAVPTGAFDLLGVLGLMPVDAETLRLVVLALCGLGAAVAVLPRRRALWATNAMVLACSAFLTSQLAGVHLPPDEADAVTLAAPVRGEWYVGHGGRAELVNGHRAALLQDHALDIVRVEDGSTRDGDAGRLQSYHAYGEPVLSPADGRVVTVVTGRPDQAIGTTDVDNAAGNHVVIDIGGGRYVVLAHLRPGSVQVGAGERVRAGQQLAEVGNSGNTSEPHLHMQLQNVETLDVIAPPDGARTYPWLLSDVTVTRSGATSQQAAADLRRGDRFVS